MDAFWIMLTGALVAVCGGLLGCFLLLRGMTLIADAISHAVLPGIVLAYLVSQSRDTLPMLLGAAVFGVFSTALIEWLHRRARFQADAAMGLVFTFLFAVGVILVSQLAGQVDLDQECVLYGEIAFTPLNRLILAGHDLGPLSVWLLGGLLGIIVSFILWAYKPLLMTSFDPVLATAAGLNTALWHYLLMSLVSLTTVLSFESVGAILVVAFMAVPAATAYLLTQRLRPMLWITAATGVASALGGYGLAIAADASISGSMAVCSGIFFTLAVFWSLYRRRRRAQLPKTIEQAV